MKRVKAIEKFCKKFGIKAKPDDDFCAYIGQNKIGYNFDEDYLDTFLDYVYEMYPNIEANAWVWTTLHEIGHLKSKYRGTPLSEYISEGIARMLLSTKMHHYDPNEVTATHWAAKYIKKHPKRIRKYEKSLRKELGKEVFNRYVEERD